MNPLYQQVSQQILDRIESGELSVGDRLPPEAKVAIDFGVSRSTVRLAFAELENVGVLARRKRTGTQIIAKTPQKKFSMTTQSVHELLSLGRDTTLNVHQTKLVNSADVPTLENPHNVEDLWLEVSGTRTLVNEKAPFSVNRVYVPPRFTSIEPLLSANVTSVFQLVESAFDVSVSRVTQTMRAMACEDSDAKLIGLKENAPVLRIDATLYVKDGSLMEISIATFDPDRFQIQTSIKVD